ncbi:MAG: tetratricopeptide repeat protein [Halieaceae bacterium]
MSQIKNTLFTTITVVVIPLLFFVLLEGILRLAGVGTHFDYFNEIEINDEVYFQENINFADQFYPPSLNVGPLQNTFIKKPSDDRLRVFVLGGSAAMGFPHKNHGVDRLLAAQLNALFPDKDVEVINTAMTSVNSHVVHQVAETLPADSADFAVILMGNNEVVGPYGPGTFNQNFLSSLTAIRTLQALKRTRLWQWLDNTFQEVQATDAKADLEWQGMQMFVENGVAESDPRMDDVYEHFDANLRDIIDVLSDKGMHVILSTVPVNLRHSAPFLSIENESLAAEQREQVSVLRERATAQSRNQKWKAAATLWREVIALDPGHADSHFQLATSLERQGNHIDARRHFERALDLDALRFRADTHINARIKAVAKDYPDSAISFVDSAAAFDHASAPLAPGWESLVEHVHYTFAGNDILARVFARAIATHVEGERPTGVLNSKQVAERVGYPNHETIENIQNLQGMAEQPPFPGQSNYQDYLAHMAVELSKIKGQVGEPKDVVRRRQKVLTEGTADWKVHFEMAALAKYLKNKQAQYYHLTTLNKVYPHNRESQMNLATLLSQDGRWAEAIPVLERSLSYTRGREQQVVETLGWLGTAKLRVGETEEAVALLESIPRDYPGQIGLSLRAYGNLIKYAVDLGDRSAVDRYLEELQAYANRLKDTGQADSYPLLARRMVQLLTMGGDKVAAKRWQ